MSENNIFIHQPDFLPWIGFFQKLKKSNIFVVLDGEVLTPTLASGCLPGVTRELMIEWFKIKEAELPMSVLEVAEEIFLTSSTRGIHPVVRLDQRFLEVGSVTSDLRQQFQSLAAREINP